MTRTRIATAADADALTATMLEGIATYAAFAPAGWSPPPPGVTRGTVLTRMGVCGTWCLVAEDGEGPLGHVAFLPAVHTQPPTGDSRLAHLWMLFARERAWGTGLATDLLRRAVAEGRLRGYRDMRLFVAVGQARARRFYEREGWAPAGPPLEETSLGLPLLEYRRPLR